MFSSSVLLLLLVLLIFVNRIEIQLNFSCLLLLLFAAPHYMTLVKNPKMIVHSFRCERGTCRDCLCVCVCVLYYLYLYSLLFTIFLATVVCLISLFLLLLVHTHFALTHFLVLFHLIQALYSISFLSSSLYSCCSTGKG